MKKILLSILTIALVSVVAVGATRSYYSDTEASNGNNFVAGKLDLELGAGATLPFNVSNVVPGQSGEGKVTLTNVAGSIPGKLNVNLTNLVQLENGIIEPEVGLNGEYTPATGELGIFLRFAAFVDVNKNGIYDAGDIQLAYSQGGPTGQVLPYSQINYLAWSGINGMTTSWNDVMTMTDGQSVDVIVMWQFPTVSPDPNYSENISMTDSLSFDLGFILNQAH